MTLRCCIFSNNIVWKGTEGQEKIVKCWKLKDFENALPKILKRIGMNKIGWVGSQLISKSPIVVEVPEDFDFKGVLGNTFKQCGIKMIYVDCKTDAPDSIFAKMDSVCWFANISSE